MSKLITYFTDKDNPSIGVTLKYFKNVLQWSSNHTFRQTKIYYAFMLWAALSLLNQIVYLAYFREPEMILAFLEFSAHHLGLVKLITIEFYHRYWKDIIGRIAVMEKQVVKDDTCRSIVEKYSSYSRKIIIFFWTFCITCNIIFYFVVWLRFIREFEFSHVKAITQKIFYFWWPFDQSTRLGAYSYMFFQNLYGDLSAAYAVGWDSLCLSVLISCAGQMELIRVMFRRALDLKTVEEQKKNLIACHNYYLKVVAIQNICNTMLSPSLFLHLLVTSVNISVLIICLGSYSRSETISFSLFIFGILMQIYLYYWHGNEVIVQSNLVSYSIFESNWTTKDKDIRRMILFMSMSTSKKLKFSAGPFNKVSLNTAIGILRVSYSFYTLMSGTNNYK